MYKKVKGGIKKMIETIFPDYNRIRENLSDKSK